MKLAMHAAGAAHVLLIEEPENHLSFSSMTQLIDRIAAEEQLIKANSLAELNTVLGKTFADEVALLKYMKGHKTDTALAIFNSPHSIRFPDYVQRAIT